MQLSFYFGNNITIGCRGAIYCAPRNMLPIHFVQSIYAPHKNASRLL